MRNFSLLLLLLFALSFDLHGYTVVRDSVKTVGGITIPVTVMIPDGTGEFPVHFHVHGGGWKGGSETKVPGASPFDAATELCDNLQIVFVGVGYRCMLQNGDFDKAMSDVLDTYKWVKKRAKRFKCDFELGVGFSGGSAGTPLSSMAAMMIPECNLYIGINGFYDFINRGDGNWPPKETAIKYKVNSPKQRLRASSAMHIKQNPPATLLVHGDKDRTSELLQSQTFAQKVKDAGGYSQLVTLEGVGHAFYKPWYGELYIETSIAAMHHFIKFFKIENPNVEGAKEAIIDKVEKTIQKPINF